MIRNVVILNDFAHVNGGASQVAILSACELSKAGYKVYFFCGTAPIDQRLFDSGVEVVCTHQHDIASHPSKLLAMGQGLWNVSSKEAIASLLKPLDRAHTIVHLHGWTKTLSSSVVAVCAQMGFKIVCTLHDYFVACPNGGFYNYQSKDICQLKPLSVNCIATNCDARSYGQKVWRVVRQGIQQGAGKLPSSIGHYISVSQFSEDILREYLPARAKIYRVPNPIETLKSPPANVSRNRDFIFVGRISPEKGAYFLASATKSTELSIVYIGDGPDRAAMMQAFPKLNMPGWAKPADVASAISKARAIVFPSLWYETQGLVVAEAAALGVPAVVSDGTAARDMVVNNETGLWFESGNPSSLVNALNSLTNDELVARLGGSAYANYWKMPSSVNAHLDALLQVYEQCVV